MRIFKAQAFEKQNETIKFKPTTCNQQLNPSKILKKQKKMKKANRLKDAATANADGASIIKKVNLGGVRATTGHIVKSKNKGKQQQLKKTPYLEKAVKETLKASKFILRNNSNKAVPTLSSSLSSRHAINEFEMKLQTQLMGGRFRYINEQLYTMSSDKAEQLFREDPTAFEAYHEGYRRQLQKWPINPLQRIIRLIKRYPKSCEIGDFGCGDGLLAQSIPNKVYSFDLISLRPHIIACDMAHTPLHNENLDVAVYCLSLMNSNINEFILEANRVLKLNGLLIIAEIQTRFDNVKNFVRSLESYGFHLIKQDTIRDIFYIFQLKKVRYIGKVAIVPDLTLKPCLYKKR